MQSGVTVVGLLSATSLSGSAVGPTSVPSSSLQVHYLHLMDLH